MTFIIFLIRKSHIILGCPLYCGEEAMACHRCSAVLRPWQPSTQCVVCSCKYHVHDCGQRCEIAGVAKSVAKRCPRCTGACCCGGGPVVCHSALQRLKRGKPVMGGSTPQVTEPVLVDSAFSKTHLDMGVVLVTVTF